MSQSTELPDLDRLSELSDEALGALKPWVVRQIISVARRAQPEGEAPQAVHITPQQAAAAGIECGDTACGGCNVGEPWCIHAPAAQPAESGAQVTEAHLSQPVEGDAVAKAKRIMALVDDYVAKTFDTNERASMARLNIRIALMAEFENAAAQSQGAQAAELCIGFANNDQGVHVNVMQRQGDGTTIVLHQGRVPAGDSFARFALAAKAEAPAPADDVLGQQRWSKEAEMLESWSKPAAQQAAAPGALELLNADELAALRRFDETCQDGEGYDVPKAMMQRLAAIGVVRRTSGSYYETTDFGLRVLDQRAPSAPGTPEAPKGGA